MVLTNFTGLKNINFYDYQKWLLTFNWTCLIFQHQNSMMEALMAFLNRSFLLTEQFWLLVQYLRVLYLEGEELQAEKDDQDLRERTKGRKISMEEKARFRNNWIGPDWQQHLYGRNFNLIWKSLMKNWYSFPSLVLRLSPLPSDFELFSPKKNNRTTPTMVGTEYAQLNSVYILSLTLTGDILV